ncbi:MAG: hypothetical protein P8189_18005 [Anaerolineae bacterium]|jgi:hypothetical protein
MPTKQQAQSQIPQAGLLAQAIEDLHINVPIYQVHTLQNGGLRLWLYGHRTPVDWSPIPERGTPPQEAASPPPKRRSSRRTPRL